MLQIANAPVSWGVDFPDQPGAPSWAEVLDGIRAAGYRRVELGPYGFLPTDAGELTEELALRGLDAAGGLIYEPVHDPTAHERIEALTRRVAEWIAAVGGEYLIIVPMAGPERDGWAGRAADAPALERFELDAQARLVDELARIADGQGLVPAVHPHAGTYVESLAEFEELMSRVQSQALRLCIDTGHCLYAGMDPVRLTKDYAEIVAGFHLKDLDRARLERALSQSFGFEAAVAADVFRPLGEGDVDFDAFAEVVAALPGRLWATVEQDVEAGKPGDPVGDAATSLAFLAEKRLAESS